MRPSQLSFDKAAFNGVLITVLWLVILLYSAVSVNTVFAATPSEPFVAIHVSELTQALETMPALAPTPTGTGNSGFQWWYTSWHYFVGYESLKEALRSDGTPFVEISDSDISAGRLRHPDGSPRYPILISLASEAIADTEISPLREYVNAGGFLIVGSSSFTRNPDGTTRGDCALANEVGVRMANPTLLNRYENVHFIKSVDDWLVSHFPGGQLLYRTPKTSEEIPLGVSPAHTIHNAHYAWQVVANGATVLATGDSGPLVTLKKYGLGQIVYHGAFQPLVGHGGFDPAMYAYLIYRKAIDLAFTTMKVPMVRLSPWRYPYDAALLVRHDFENRIDLIKAIESSAQYEKTAGVKGEYYFSTGALRTYSGSDKAAIISGVKNAVSSFGAAIGSHNGGLPNPVNLSLLPTDYDYWHWGPDEALDQSPPGYANGRAYASASILASFIDIEGWLAGLDNGRPGCGSTGSCPRIWVSPAFNSTREVSNEIIQELPRTVSMGEQKISPYPHWTMSYATPGKHYSHLSLPVSEWYGGAEMIQSLDTHTSWTMRAGVDLYYDLGALINYYGHAPSNNGNVQQEYITYALTKPKVWPTNSVGVFDWWKQRSTVHVTPSFTATDTDFTLTATISGATDSETAIEINVPSFYGGSRNIFLNGVLANASEYRSATNGIKVRVGTLITTVKIQNAPYTPNTAPVAANDTYSTTKNKALNPAVPGVLANDTDPEGTALTAQLVSGPSHGTLTLNSNGSFLYTPTTGYSGSDSFTYKASDGSLTSNTATVSITVTVASTAVFSDNFTLTSAPPDPLSLWTGQLGTWAVTNGALQGLGAASAYGYAFVAPTPLWSNYALEGRIQFPSGAFGGGLGGRLNPSTGSHYGAWVYPDTSLGGANVLKLIKFRDWTSWSGSPMAQVSLPGVGTGWHNLKLVFSGSRIQVYYDGTLMMDGSDGGFDSRAAYLTGGISIDLATLPGYVGAYGMAVDDVVVSAVP